MTKDLKLIALDSEDLSVLSAHLQDAVLRMEDLAYLKGEQRFVMILNRFDWQNAPDSRKGKFARLQAALRFERVVGAKFSGLNVRDLKRVLSLLAITFDAGDAPSGDISLLFSGGGAIRLRVECIEMELRDLGAQWATKKRPDHPEDS